MKKRLWQNTRYVGCLVCKGLIARRRMDKHLHQHKLDRLMGTTIASNWRFMKAEIVIDKMAPENSMYFLNDKYFTKGQA